MNTKFDYGDFIIEYRIDKDGFLNFLKQRITDIDTAIKESNKLKDLGYHDILIKKTERK